MIYGPMLHTIALEVNPKAIHRALYVFDNR